MKIYDLAKLKGIKVITEVNLALDHWDENRPIVIGVTGTNGKSSFVKFLNDYLNFVGHSSKIAGNYGIGT